MKALDIIEEIKNEYDVNHDPYLMMDLEKIEKAIKIIIKYIVLENDEDDEYELFPYDFKAEQYVSSGSCKVMSKEEYEILKEVLG